MVIGMTVQAQCAWMWGRALPRVIKNILLQECTTFNFKSLIGSGQRISYRRKGYLGMVEGVTGGCAVCALQSPAELLYMSLCQSCMAPPRTTCLDRSCSSATAQVVILKLPAIPSYLRNALVVMVENRSTCGEPCWHNSSVPSPA